MRFGGDIVAISRPFVTHDLRSPEPLTRVIPPLPAYSGCGHIWRSALFSITRDTTPGIGGLSGTKDPDIAGNKKMKSLHSAANPLDIRHHSNALPLHNVFDTNFEIFPDCPPKRYDRPPRNFLASICIAATIVWWSL